MTARSQREGTWFAGDDAKDVAAGASLDFTADEQELYTENVEDPDVIRFWMRFTSDAVDNDEQLILRVVTSPDGVVFEDEEWELPFAINNNGLNTPLHIPFETDGIHSVRAVGLENTSAAANITGAYSPWRKGRRRS
jgi:hypothetical protein